MFRLIQKGKERGDCTAFYEVHLEKKLTVGELVDYIVSKEGNRGSIMVTSYHGGCVFPYRYGTLGELPARYKEDIKPLPVKNATCQGGYSFYDFTIYI